jgi:hypothetical protein
VARNLPAPETDFGKGISMTKKPVRQTGGPVETSVPRGGKEGAKEIIIPSTTPIISTVKDQVLHNINVRIGEPLDPSIVTVSLPRAQVEQIMGDMMSALSRRAYGSHWITGTTSSLMILTRYVIEHDSPTQWGQTLITVEEAKMLFAFALALGYWLIRDDASGLYEPFKLNTDNA